MLNENHLKWCQLHDWGLNAKLENGVITNIDEWLFDTNTRTERHNKLSFSDYKSLRNWAGY